MEGLDIIVLLSVAIGTKVAELETMSPVECDVVLGVANSSFSVMASDELRGKFSKEVSLEVA